MSSGGPGSPSNNFSPVDSFVAILAVFLVVGISVSARSVIFRRRQRRLGLLGFGSWEEAESAPGSNPVIHEAYIVEDSFENVSKRWDTLKPLAVSGINPPTLTSKGNEGLHNAQLRAVLLVAMPTPTLAPNVEEHVPKEESLPYFELGVIQISTDFPSLELVNVLHTDMDTR